MSGPVPAVTAAHVEPPRAAQAPPAPIPARGVAGIPPAFGPLPGGPGAPLPGALAARVSAALGADVSGVRVHAGSGAAAAAAALGARAFTIGNRIFLGAREQIDDVAVIAHEVAHTVQQHGSAVVQRWSSGSGDGLEREAEQASAAVVAGSTFAVQGRTAPVVQRLGIDTVLNFLGERANAIPGFRMLTVVLGLNPITMSRVDRTPANVLRAVIELVPGGLLLTQALDAHGIVEKVATWVEQQVRTLAMTGAQFRQGLDRFLGNLGWSDILRPGDVWDRAKRIFTDPIGRLIDFGSGLVVGVIRFVKDAILLPLAKLAQGTPGYTLLTAVLGFDPITGAAVPRTADTLIGPFMTMIGQAEVWENLKKSNAVGRAWTWFQTSLTGLLAFVRQIPATFVDALKALELVDIVVVTRAFAKLARVFAGLVGRFAAWAGGQVLSLLQIISEVVAPAVMPYLRKAMGAFRTIVANPVGFVGNLVRAGATGFRQFAARFLEHLRGALIGWLTGSLAGAGIYVPQAFEIREIIKFVLSVLGLTWQNIRTKLVKAIGEPAVGALEKAFDIVVTLVKEGPAAAWEKIREQLTNLREMVMEQVMTFVKEKIVVAAVTKLVTSLNPAGAFIQAVIAIYNTVLFVVERIKQIAAVGAAVIDSIAAIAAGAVGAAANKVEQTMAGLLTLVVSFLARLTGLGKVSDAVIGVVNKLRAPIDRALDKVVEWIVSTAKKLGRSALQVGVPQDPVERLRLGGRAALGAVNRFAGKRVGGAVLDPLLSAIKIRYGFSRLEAVPVEGRWRVRGKINPDFYEATESLTPERLVPGADERTLLLGEGNFTFALSIAATTSIGSRLVATDYTVKERVSLVKSAKSTRKARLEAERNRAIAENVAVLTSLGVSVMHQVDATDPSSYPKGSYRFVVFNHPFTVTKDDKGRTVRFGEKSNILLIEAFLRAARQQIVEGGQIILISSLARLQRWRLDEIAGKLGLTQSVEKFLTVDFPGYRHEKTLSAESAESVSVREQFAVVFTVTAEVKDKL